MCACSYGAFLVINKQCYVLSRTSIDTVINMHLRLQADSRKATIVANQQLSVTMSVVHQKFLNRTPQWAN